MSEDTGEPSPSLLGCLQMGHSPQHVPESPSELHLTAGGGLNAWYWLARDILEGLFPRHGRAHRQVQLVCSCHHPIPTAATTVALPDRSN